jgi:hypothetical protein
MSILESQIAATLLPGMSIPQELSQLFSWIEENTFYIDRDADTPRIGLLCPKEMLNQYISDFDEDGDEIEARNGGTDISFHAEGNVNLHHWFGHDKPEVLDRLCVFARTGGDGSMAAFWLDDEGNQKIVHLGSGSGSFLVCQLADNAIDFMRLLAIGYDEICWNENFNLTPEQSFELNMTWVKPNRNYQNWLTQTFDVSIPERANEIIKHPAEMGDTETKDPFCLWVEKHSA